MKPLLPLALLAAACGGGGHVDPDPELDAGTDATVDPDPCARASLDAPWLDAQLAMTLRDVTRAPRATTTQRDDARSYLLAQLAAQGWNVTRHDYPGGANVLAEVPATRPDGDHVVVGAHFDTVEGTPGASDNATGVAVVVALGRYLQEVPCRSGRVTLALFDQEEQGLFGSRALAMTLDPSQVSAVHTIDQVGWDGDGDRRFELELPTPALETAWRAAAEVVGVSLVTTTSEGTDHESFRARGFAAVGLSEEYVSGDTSPHYHLPSDTASTVDAAYLALAAKLTAEVVITQIIAD